jgi:hypothetical protein
LAVDMAQRVEFLAVIAPIQSAIKIGDAGARLTLDIDEQSLADMLPLINMRDALLRVVVQVATDRQSDGE